MERRASLASKLWNFVKSHIKKTIIRIFDIALAKHITKFEDNFTYIHKIVDELNIKLDKLSEKQTQLEQELKINSILVRHAVLMVKFGFKDKDIRVGVIIHNIDTFYSIKDVIDLLLYNEKVNVDIILIPNNYYSTRYEDSLNYLNRAIKILTENSYSFIFINLDMCRNVEYVYNILLNLNPHYIILQSPWDEDRPLPFKASLLNFAKILYIPYYPLTLIESFTPYGDDLHFNKDFHNIVYRIYAQSEMDFNYYRKFQTIKAKNVKIVGSTKLYAAMKARETCKKKSERFTILWAPHHSVSSNWIGFGTFHKIYDKMYSFAANNKDLYIIYRPHPLLKKSLADNGIMSIHEYEEWLENFSKLENVKIDDNPFYFETFCESDLLITDGMSFIIEWPIATAKPGIFLYDGNINSNMLTYIGKIGLEYFYKCSVEELDEVLDLLSNNDKNCFENLFSFRYNILPELERFVPRVNPAKLIVDDILEDFYNSIGPWR